MSERERVTERVVRDTVRDVREVVSHDTLWRSDSVVVRADGVDRWRTVYRTRWAVRTDTVYRAVRDTSARVVTVRDVVTETVKRKRAGGSVC